MARIDLEYLNRITHDMADPQGPDTDRIAKVFTIGDYICLIRWIPPRLGADSEGAGYLRSMTEGHFCGYVSVPDDHPMHGHTYQASSDVAEISVHGGVTYSSSGVVSFPEFERASWWLGFDCAHLGDCIETCNEEFVARNCSVIVSALAAKDTRESTIYIDDSYQVLCDECGEWCDVILQKGVGVCVTIHNCPKIGCENTVTVAVVGMLGARVEGIKTRRKPKE